MQEEKKDFKFWCHWQLICKDKEDFYCGAHYKCADGVCRDYRPFEES